MSNANLIEIPFDEYDDFPNIPVECENKDCEYCNNYETNEVEDCPFL